MINVTVPDEQDTQLSPKIFVIGVGGAGGNAVNNMIRSNLEGVNFVVANTDAQALKGSQAEHQVQLGAGTTRGLGAGSRPEIGSEAAEEALSEIMDHLEGANMVFITAGMGGGTGTGAAPVIARSCREAGMLTVGVVTKPFHFEGAHRMRTAEAGIKDLQGYVDTLIVIPNQNLFRVANEKTTFADAFKMADDVLHSGVRGVTDLMVMPGLINLDFADIKTVMQEMGKAMMGTGEASGERRAIEAAEAAISNPLLEDTSMKGARGILINITGGMDMTLFEVDEAANRIREEVDPDANIIFGSTFDEAMDGIMRVSVVATGIDVQNAQQPRPLPQPQTHAVAGGMRAAAPRQAVAAPPQPTPVQPAAHQPVARPAAAARPAPAPEPEMIPEVAHDAVAYHETAHDPYGHELDDEPVLPEVAELDRMLTQDDDSAGPDAPQSGLFGTGQMAEEAEDLQHRPFSQRRDDAFIPPAPVDPGHKPEIDHGARPDPFAAAALANGGRGEEKARRRSLFDRVTGRGRDMEAENHVEKATPAPASSRPAAASVSSQPRLSKPAAPPAAAASPAPRQAAATARRLDPAAQPSLNIAAASPAASPETEEDLLDIPAFLRRQAN